MTRHKASRSASALTAEFPPSSLCKSLQTAAAALSLVKFGADSRLPRTPNPRNCRRQPPQGPSEPDCLVPSSGPEWSRGPLEVRQSAATEAAGGHLAPLRCWDSRWVSACAPHRSHESTLAGCYGLQDTGVSATLQEVTRHSSQTLECIVDVADGARRARHFQERTGPIASLWPNVSDRWPDSSTRADRSSCSIM